MRTLFATRSSEWSEIKIGLYPSISPTETRPCENAGSMNPAPNKDVEAALRIIGGRRGSHANDPQVRINEAAGGELRPGFLEYSVFELLTTEYDFEYGLGDSSARIQELACDSSQFVRVRKELPQLSLCLTTNTDLRRVRPGDWPAAEMFGNPGFPAWRANLKGQPIIYLADSTATALKECRIEPGQTYTEARFQVVKPLTLVDIRGQSDAGMLDPFATLDLWMSRPVNKDAGEIEEAERYHYYVTKLFSSIVRNEKFDGLEFTSSVQGGGWNVALFDPSNVRPIWVESR